MCIKFSVIIPVYNAQKYLRECIDSVLLQTYKNFEIILVNDGSSDSSGEICDEYKEKYSEIISVIHSENRGALIARNIGIKKAVGDVLMFLDSDDKLRCDTLKLINDAVVSSGCDLVVFNGSCSESYDVPFRVFPFANGSVYEGCGKEALYRALVETAALNNVCLKAAKKSVFDFDMEYSGLPHIRHGEDLLMSAQMLTSAQKVFILDECLYYYRSNTSSVTNSTQKGKAESIKEVHRFLETLIPKWGFLQLEPLHYAREVRGWIDTLKLLACEMPYKEYRKTVIQMAEDSYFRNAYEKSDAGKLDLKNRLKAKLLYGKKYLLFCLVNYLSVRK